MISLMEGDLRRRGEIQISFDLLYHPESHGHLLKMFGKMVVLRTSTNYTDGVVTYTVLCELFDLIEDSILSPTYTFVFTNTNGKVVLSGVLKDGESELRTFGRPVSSITTTPPPVRGRRLLDFL